MFPSAWGPQKPAPKPELWGFPGYLTAEQVAALKDFKAGILGEGLLGERNMVPDPDLLRFLRAREFNVRKATEMLRKDLDWRRGFEGRRLAPADYPSINKLMGSGVLYRAGFDKDGRVVLVSRLCRLFPKEVQDLSELPRYWVSYMQLLVGEMTERSCVDYTTIADLANFSPSRNFSLAFIKTLIGARASAPANLARAD